MQSDKHIDPEKAPLIPKQVKKPERRYNVFICLLLVTLLCKAAWFITVFGYFKHSHLSHDQIERLLLASPLNVTIQEFSRAYTGYAHRAGSQGDFDSAVHVKRTWELLLGVQQSRPQDQIFDAGTPQSRDAFLHHGKTAAVHIDTYYPLLNKPIGNSSVTFHDQSGAVVFRASLKEDVLAEDPTSKHGNEDVPVFHGYSKAGAAQGSLVYANLGRKEDYDELAERGISLNGTIVLVRYGGNFRGIKVSLAEEAGAVGVLVYSDPAEDGEITLKNGYKAYPHGPARQPSSVQRGSVQRLSLYAGDPLTPGKPAYKNADRLKRDAKNLNIPGIPSLPISYTDALPLLLTLRGKGVEIPHWRGGLNLTYFTGPGEGTVRMDNQVVEDVKPIWNVYAVIPGEITDEVIVLGNHRDAWVYGASDPNAGSASVDAIVEGLGRLMRHGWKPRRTIVIASWDGEEYGLLGSTEFGEDFGKWLQKHAAIYLNVDSAASGSIYDVKASPSLARFLHEMSAKVAAPGQKDKSLADYYPNVSDIGPLGSGSDFTVFLQHLGIASSDLSFRRGAQDPVYHYHSIYDSEYWMETFGDVGFHRHVAVAQMIGISLINAADRPMLPLNLTDYGAALHRYVSLARKAAKDTIPKAPTTFDKLDFKALDRVVKAISHATDRLDVEIIELQTSANTQTVQHKSKLKAINKRLRNFEQNFLDKDGLTGREWYRHLVIAPARLLGYGAQPMPGFIESITLDRDGDKAQKELERLVRVLEKVRDGLE